MRQLAWREQLKDFDKGGVPDKRAYALLVGEDMLVLGLVAGLLVAVVALWQIAGPPSNDPGTASQARPLGYRSLGAYRWLFVRDDLRGLRVLWARSQWWRQWVAASVHKVIVVAVVSQDPEAVNRLLYRMQGGARTVRRGGIVFVFARQNSAISANAVSTWVANRLVNLPLVGISADSGRLRDAIAVATSGAITAANTALREHEEAEEAARQQREREAVAARVAAQMRDNAKAFRWAAVYVDRMARVSGRPSVLARVKKAERRALRVAG